MHHKRDHGEYLTGGKVWRLRVEEDAYHPIAPNFVTLATAIASALYNRGYESAPFRGQKAAAPFKLTHHSSFCIHHSPFRRDPATTPLIPFPMMMMKIYTKTGDDGSTSLFGGIRVHKANTRVGAYGSVDEFNATLALARTAISNGNHASQNIPFSDLDAILNTLQNFAFQIGAALASPSRDPDDSAKPSKKSSITQSDIDSIENWIDQHEKSLPQLRTFILPGGSELAARLHHARTVCRRAEREVAALCQLENNAPADQLSLILLNRISDLLFVLARIANARLAIPDVPWHPPSPKTRSDD